MGRSNSKNDTSANSKNDRNQLVAADDIPAQRRRQTSDIFKMDLDCFEETFDYLVRKDLISFARTCKYLNNLVGFHILQNNSGAVVNYNSDEAKYFTSYITILAVSTETYFQHFVNNQTKFGRLKEIELSHIELTAEKIQSIEGILNKVLTLRINTCKIDKDNIELMMSYCTLVKRLYVVHWELDRWPEEMKCPTLECLKFSGETTYGLIGFIRRNPNIKTVGFRLSFGAICCVFMQMESDGIAIPDFTLVEDNISQLEDYCYLLRRIYKSGLVKRIQLGYNGNFDQEEADILARYFATFEGMDVKLYTPNIGYLNFSSFNNFQEIIPLGFFEFNFANIPKRIKFHHTCPEYLTSIISRAERLEKFAFNRFSNNGNEVKIINLRALNKEREELAKGRDLKVTIYVNEEIYTATKWAMDGNECGLIVMQRLDSNEWSSRLDDHLMGYFHA